MSADGCREAVAHGPKAPRGDPGPGFLEAVVERGPHLVLADLACDDTLAVQDVAEFLDDVLRAKVAVIAVAEGVLRLPGADPTDPARRITALLHPLEDRLEDSFDVTHDRDIDDLVLPDLGRVDIDMDDRRVRREGLNLARHPVIEPDADGYQEVALRHRVVRGLGAVHPEHPEVERVIAGDGAEPHQGRRDGDPCRLDELQEFGRCPREDHAPAGIDERALRSCNKVYRLVDLADMPLIGGLVTAEGDCLRDGFAVPHLARADVFGEIDQHRTGPSGPGDVEGFLNDAIEIVGIFDQIVVLRHRHRDPGDVRLLERIVPEEAGGHLTGERHDRNGVHIRRRDPCNQVARAGAGGGKAYAYAAACTRVPVGRVRRCLLMPYQNMPDRRIVEFIVDRQHYATGVAEYGVHPFTLQRVNQSPGSGFHALP